MRINAQNCFDWSSPLDGYKQISFGREMAPHAPRPNTQTKSVSDFSASFFDGCLAAGPKGWRSHDP